MPPFAVTVAAGALVGLYGNQLIDPLWSAYAPLLLLLAAQYLRAGVRIAALLDMTPRSNALRALPHLPAAFWPSARACRR